MTNFEIKPLWETTLVENTFFSSGVPNVLCKSQTHTNFQKTQWHDIINVSERWRCKSFKKSWQPSFYPILAKSDVDEELGKLENLSCIHLKNYDQCVLSRKYLIIKEMRGISKQLSSNFSILYENVRTNSRNT